jgi:prolyl-tRNA synthetase
MQGVPIRLELGPRDLKNNAVMLVRRDTGDKQLIARTELQETIQKMMIDITITLKARADETLKNVTTQADTYEELKTLMMSEEQGLVAINWCNEVDCANKIKENLSAGILGERHDIHEDPTGPCVVCDRSSNSRVYVAASY